MINQQQDVEIVNRLIPQFMILDQQLDTLHGPLNILYSELRNMTGDRAARQAQGRRIRRLINSEKQRINSEMQRILQDIRKHEPPTPIYEPGSPIGSYSYGESSPMPRLDLGDLDISHGESSPMQSLHLGDLDISQPDNVIPPPAGSPDYSPPGSAISTVPNSPGSPGSLHLSDFDISRSDIIDENPSPAGSPNITPPPRPPPVPSAPRRGRGRGGTKKGEKSTKKRKSAKKKTKKR